MFLSNKARFLFSFNGKEIFFGGGSMRRQQGDVSLATPLFAQLLQTAAKEKTCGSPAKPDGAQKEVIRICKRCVNKGGGEWLGRRELYGAHMGALLLVAGGG
jgi:hypothetical protein